MITETEFLLIFVGFFFWLCGLSWASRSFQKKIHDLERKNRAIESSIDYFGRCILELQIFTNHRPVLASKEFFMTARKNDIPSSRKLAEVVQREDVSFGELLEDKRSQQKTAKVHRLIPKGTVELSESMIVGPSEVSDPVTSECVASDLSSEKKI